MRTLAALATTALIGLAIASAAVAAQNKATTTLENAPVAGTTLYVTFTVSGTTPVVPYEYALQNTCTYPPKTFGHFTLGQHDDIATWTDQGPNGEPRVTMPVYLQSVPRVVVQGLARAEQHRRQGLRRELHRSLTVRPRREPGRADHGGL